MTENKIIFSACKHLDFADNYIAKKELISVNGETKVVWNRPVIDSSYPNLVQFCKLRGRLNNPDSCLCENNKKCDDFENKKHEVKIKEVKKMTQENEQETGMQSAVDAAEGATANQPQNQIVNKVTEITNFNSELKGEVDALAVNDDVSLGIANDILKRTKQAIKRIEEREKEFTKPLNDTLKKIREQFKPQREFAKEIKNILEQEKIIPYKMEQDRIIREKAEKERQDAIAKARAEQTRLEELAKKTNSMELQKAAEQKAAEAAVAESKKINVDTATRTAKSTTSIRNVWVGEIVEPDAVPRGYCEPSQVLVNAAVRAGKREISGVKVYEKASVFSR